jgi:beta-N-acetylhexosaminidase
MTPAGPRAAIVGLAGAELLPEEVELFRSYPPAGFILFARNCREPAQLRALTTSLRALWPERRVPILVDQEGGRVMRLKPPHWRSLPAAARAGALACRDRAAGAEAARLTGALIAHDLAAVGIDVDCAPCLDVARAETTTAIGDRAFAADPVLVGELGRAFMAGLAAGGVLPVIKHLPGHGRARTDSHLALPVVDADLDELERVDLVPFRMCVDAPFAMTAHLLFPRLDPERPATQSPRIIREVIRGRIGFEGLLLSDDLGMAALTGGIAERAVLALRAGCDLALHCSGDFAELEALLSAVPDLPPAAFRQLQAALAAGDGRRVDDAARAQARLDDLLAVA